MPIELTPAQKQARADISRLNGRKSRGPVTPAGKYRSSMNAITTGTHLDLHKEDLPPFFHLLTTDDRAAYLRLFQSHLRKFRPDSEYEHGLLRRMAVEMFQFDRNTTLATQVMQQELDAVVREFPDIILSAHLLQGATRAAQQKDLLRLVERQKKAHMAAYHSLLKAFTQTRKLFPMQPPEPVDITADTRTLEDPGPPPEVVAEILALADQAQKEPTFVLPQYARNFLQDHVLMQRFAPHYNASDLLIRLVLEDAPIAA